MKKAILTIMCAALFLAGCARSADQASRTASDFLEAFFKMDYAGAAAFCSSDISALLMDTIPADAYPSEEIRDKVHEASRGTGFKIVSSSELPGSDSVRVSYEIQPYGAARGTVIARTMTLVKTGRDFKIVSLE